MDKTRYTEAKALEIGEAIATVRNQQGLSQTALGEAAGMSQPRIADREKGKFKNFKLIQSTLKAIGCDSVEELLDMAREIRDAQAQQAQGEIPQKRSVPNTPNPDSIPWGKLIRKRRIELNVSMDQVASRAKISKERLHQIENGIFHVSNPTITTILQLLGYPNPSNIYTLRDDTPETPQWLAEVEKKPSHNGYQDLSEDDLQRHIEIGQAFATVRIDRGFSQTDVSEASGIPQSNIANIEAGNFKKLKTAYPLLEHYGFNNVEQLLGEAGRISLDPNSASNRNSQNPDNIDKLSAASIILRTYWGMPAAGLAKYTASPRYVLEDPWSGPPRIRNKILNLLESHNGTAIPSIEKVIAWVGALYNADQEQPEERRLLGTEKIKYIADIANEVVPLTEKAGFKIRLEGAIAEIDEITKKIEPAIEPQTKGSHPIGMHWQHRRNKTTPPNSTERE